MKMYRTMLLLLPLLSACAQQPLRPTAVDSTLEQWVDRELSPYLAAQLGQHPRFKGEPVMLVRMQDQDIQPEIDQLTASIRTRVRDALLGTPGINLPWQPNRREQRHHRRLAEASCGSNRTAGYFLGIEITVTPGGQHRVSLRALDVRARQWVGGFSKSWQGLLNSNELQALNRLQSDESLRGLRALPFDTDQADLAADYLANNLSCLLRQQDENHLVIHVRSMRHGQKQFPRLLQLVANNLSRYREVTVTEQVAEAGFQLSGEIHQLTGDLFQVWLVLQPRASGVHLSGMDTAVYIGRSAAASAYVALPGPAVAAAEMAVQTDQRGSRSLQVDVAARQQLFVLVHSRRAGLTRLLPGSCAPLPVPAGDGQRYLFTRLDGGEATYYGITVGDPHLRQKIAAHLGRLPDTCGTNHAADPSSDRLRPWLDRLDRMIEDNQGRIAWTARRGGGA